MAERAGGAAAGADDFVLVWIGVGLGLATVLGGRLHRGVAGAAGEIGYLPVPGAPLPQDVTHPATGAFQSLAGAQAVLPLAAGYGFAESTAGAAVRAAVAAAAAGDERGDAFLTELAGRVATGVASVCLVLDPGLVVLGGEVGLAGGTALAGGSRPRWAGSARPAAGRPDRRDRRPGAARRDPGRGRPGPRGAARLRGEHVNRAERWLPPSWRSTERR